MKVMNIFQFYWAIPEVFFFFAKSDSMEYTKDISINGHSREEYREKLISLFYKRNMAPVRMSHTIITMLIHYKMGVKFIFNALHS